MGKFSTWSKEEDEAVLKLYSIYGANFTEICRQLKSIYGIKKNRTTLISHWRVIDPKADPSKLSYEEENLLWDTYKECGNNFEILQATLPEYFNIFINLFHQEKQILIEVYFIFFDSIWSIPNEQDILLQEINQSIENQQIKVAKENSDNPDLMFSSVVKSSQKLMKLIDRIIVLKNRSPNFIFEELKMTVNNVEFQNILEHLFMVQTLRKIATNNITPIEYREEEDIIEVNRNKIVKTWEDAEKIVRHQQADVELTQDVQLNQKEIQLIKDSLLFKKLRPNTKSIFIDMYNEARDSLVERSQFTYVIDISKKIKKQQTINDLQLKKKDLKMKPLWKKLKEQKEQICCVKTRFNEDIQNEIHELEENEYNQQQRQQQ